MPLLVGDPDGVRDRLGDVDPVGFTDGIEEGKALGKELRLGDDDGTADALSPGWFDGVLEPLGNVDTVGTKEGRGESRELGSRVSVGNDDGFIDPLGATEGEAKVFSLGAPLRDGNIDGGPDVLGVADKEGRKDGGTESAKLGKKLVLGCPEGETESLAWLDVGFPLELGDSEGLLDIELLGELLLVGFSVGKVDDVGCSETDGPKDGENNSLVVGEALKLGTLEGCTEIICAVDGI